MKTWFNGAGFDWGSMFGGQVAEEWMRRAQEQVRAQGQQRQQFALQAVARCRETLLRAQRAGWRARLEGGGHDGLIPARVVFQRPDGKVVAGPVCGTKEEAVLMGATVVEREMLKAKG